MKWIQLAYCILVVNAVVAAIMAILVRLTTKTGTWGYLTQPKGGLSDRASSTSGNESAFTLPCLTKSRPIASFGGAPSEMK